MDSSGLTRATTGPCGFVLRPIIGWAVGRPVDKAVGGRKRYHRIPHMDEKLRPANFLYFVGPGSNFMKTYMFTYRHTYVHSLSNSSEIIILAP